MSLISVGFILFLFLTTVIYFTVRAKYQYLVLLVSSVVFYLFAGVKSSIYILITATTVYLATVAMQKIADKQKIYFSEHKNELSKEEKSIIKKTNTKKRKTIMVLTLLLNVGILCVFKYSEFAVSQLNGLLSCFGLYGINFVPEFIVPLGISFYTFQSVGYLVDVYWNKYPAEKNYLKVLLFVSFFPQITQGPISDFSFLSSNLFSEHKFSYSNYSRGVQRMMWGFFKKMAVADTLSPYVYDVFENYMSYSGITTLIGAFMYSILIYADFSGYMDIVCGFCEILGIKLTENFDRPYFSKSIAEYWRRWHISLGAWFKAYIYYPIAVSKWNKNIGKKAQKRLGKTFGKTVPASIALVVVWFTTGLWHGASSAYVAWGGVNGLFIILSLWLEPVYGKIKTKLKVNESSFAWRAFSTIRTFLLVTFIKVLPEVGTLSDGLNLWLHALGEHTIPLSLGELFPFLGDGVSFGKVLPLAAAVFGTVLMFIVSLIGRKQPVRDYIGKYPTVVRMAIFVFLFFMTVYFGIPSSGNAGGFMYAQF